jgi:Skp family chaperone for outer membrane proteins
MRSKEVIIKHVAALTITTLLVAYGTSPAAAQQPAGMNVALLDLGYIFKNHPEFKQKMDVMKKDVQAFEEQMKQQQQQLDAAGRRLSTYKPGSPEYKEIEEATTKQLAELKVQMQLKRKEIMEREAEIYMETYQQLAEVVASFANRRQIDLVLRYDREDGSTAGSADPRETLKIINRPVIFQKRLDISDLILSEVSNSVTARAPRSVPRPR